MAKAFVSYSWDSEPHKEWVRTLAARMRRDGIDVTLDQWHAAPGDQLPQFMERSIRESEYVFIVCTPKYKNRSDRRSGGVGYEGDIITGEVFTGAPARKFVPLLRQGDWQLAAPSWLVGKYYLDFRGDPYIESNYQDLLATVFKTRPAAPPLGKPPTVPKPAGAATAAATPALIAFDPIRITGVIVDEIGTPQNDGSPGSGLYDVVFRLSRSPPPVWVDYFEQGFDHPPMFTSMHRPGIASVSADRIVLNGTTVEEVERYHRNTLISAVGEANRNYAAQFARERSWEEAERVRVEAHKFAVAEAAKRITFDDPDTSVADALKRFHEATHTVFLVDAQRHSLPELERWHFQLSYAIERADHQELDVNQLPDALRRINGEVRDLVRTGWSMLYIFDRPGCAPFFNSDEATGQGHREFLECALLRDPEPRVPDADMWRVTPTGMTTLIRAYWEDQPDINAQRHLKPGTWFSPNYLACSLAEFVRHARGFAKSFNSPTKVFFRCEWHGLEGRQVGDPFGHWSPHPLARTGHRAVTCSWPVPALSTDWPKIVAELGAPVARMFDVGKVFTPEWITNEAPKWLRT